MLNKQDVEDSKELQALQSAIERRGMLPNSIEGPWV